MTAPAKKSVEEAKAFAYRAVAAESDNREAMLFAAETGYLAGYHARDAEVEAMRAKLREKEGSGPGDPGDENGS